MQLVVNDLETGLATARTVVEQDGSPGNRLEYSLLLLAAGREEQGMAELDAYRTTSDDAGLIVERILALRDLEAGRTDAAASRFDGLIRKGAFVYESLFYLGGLAEQRQSWEEARRNYSRIVGDDFAVQAQSRVARLLADHATLDAALAWLADFADQKPQYAVDMIVARSRLLEESGDVAGARLLLDQGLAAYPDAHDLVMARSFLFERTNDVRGAIADLETLRAARKGDPVVLNALGYLLVDRTRRHKEGYELVQLAHEQTPDSGPVLDSMGWALHRLGRNEEALAYLEQARERIYDPEIELHVGDVLWALGRREDARLTWSQGSERHPDDAGFKERLERHFRQ
jgi:tetratricopeptide (TPR) repeat protein